MVLDTTQTTYEEGKQADSELYARSLLINFTFVNLLAGPLVSGHRMHMLCKLVLTLMCGNYHWIITPNLTRSIQIDSWSGGPKSYL